MRRRVLIECPETGEPIETGMAMDESSWERSTMRQHTVSCPACGGTHIWSKDDAYLEPP